LLQRDAASDIAGARDMLGVNLNEEALAQRLCTYVRAGNYGAAAQVLRHPDLEDYNRDDVARAMFDPGNSPLTAREVIRAARQPAGRDLLELVRGEVTSGWTDAEEVQVGRLVDGVLGDTVARNSLNRARITVINQQVANDLERLAALFADDLIIDDDTVQSRLTAILGVTEHAVIPGLQTGVDFGDTGFAGTQDPGGAGFRDPHPSSRNQVGHFLTAVGLRVAPGVVSRRIPYFGSIRRMVGAGAGMTDDDVALRLTIGHEKAPDPQSGVDVLIDLLVAGVIEELLPGPPGETEEQQDERVARAVEARLRRNVDEIIGAFRTQFQAATDADVEAWNEALATMRAGGGYDAAAQEGPGAPLDRIAVGTGKGNSRQDLRLSMVGYRFGEMVQSGAFATRADAAAWLRANLGPSEAPTP
jgi:hypothetical protein